VILSSPIRRWIPYSEIAMLPFSFADSRNTTYALWIGTTLLMLPLARVSESNGQEFRPELFERPNLVAWCIVPFDSEKRSPGQRAAMLQDLGFTKFAYDYRAEHIPTFEEEILTLKRHGIELTAWWFPTVMNDEARMILALLKKHQVHPQLWVTGGGDPAMNSDQEKAFLASEVQRIREIATAAQEAGCQVALYNHGGWFGVPANLVRLVDAIDRPNVGIVYNLHHAHDQMDRLESNLRLLGPKLLAVNVNGMQNDGERLGQKILPIGSGDRDREWIAILGRSAYRGPVGILNPTDQDARQRLQENLDGLDRIVRDLAQQP
jgi:sugar phosphate isomerase/epimerase